MPKKTTPQKRTLTRVTDYKWLAWYQYRKLYGNRCASCSKLVEAGDSDLYWMEGLDEVILKHRECK